MEKVENTNKIFTSNTHVPYLFLLSKIPNINLTVYSRRYLGRDWQNYYRKIPSNVIHVPIDNPLLNDFYLSLSLTANKIILHCIQDLELFCNTKSRIYKDIQRIPKYYVFHNSLFTEMGNKPPEQISHEVSQMIQIFKENNIHPVFISEWKKNTWQMEGDVIFPGIDKNDFPNMWSGRNLALVYNDKVIDYSIRVCSNIEHRDFMNGYSMGNNLLQSIENPNVILGEGNENNQRKLNNSIFTVSRNLDNYNQFMAQARFYLSCNVAQYEDWYNLSLLEAVALGCPVVQTYHERQGMIPEFSKYFPITSDDPGYLISEMKRLLADRDYAQEISNKQYKLLDKYFSLSEFLTKWSLLLK